MTALIAKLRALACNYVGLAVISGICSSFSVTICKDGGLHYVTQTTAHELGHK